MVQVMLASSPDITATYLFKGHENDALTIGEEMTLLVGMSNSGDDSFQLFQMTALLHSPYEYNYIVQNFSAMDVSHIVVPAHGEVTIEYKFTPRLKLDPVEFHLSAFVWYNNTDDSEMFETSFFNSTVLMEEAVTALDFAQVFSYVLVLAVVGLIAFVFLNMTGRLDKFTQQKGSNAATDNDEMLISEHKEKTKTRAFRVKKKNKSKNKKAQEAASKKATSTSSTRR
jgi:hypothetical protein